jgi:hypothetical protein
VVEIASHVKVVIASVPIRLPGLWLVGPLAPEVVGRQNLVNGYVKPKACSAVLPVPGADGSLATDCNGITIRQALNRFNRGSRKGDAAA